MTDVDNLPPAVGERYKLAAEEELRLEVGFHKQSVCTLTLQAGSCEWQGSELAIGKPVILEGGGWKIALFTWHGCVMDVECTPPVEIGYTSDETVCNVATVNTHAQLEALRDDATTASQQGKQDIQGPRVLIVGPAESGKSTLTKILTAYATKLGRTPVVIDLDPADNSLAIPGCIGACPMQREYVTNTHGLPVEATPLALWHGSVTLQPDLYQAQVSALGRKVDTRLQTDVASRTAGCLVNTSPQLPDDYEALLHTISALSISIVLVLGHDRLYSMLTSSLKAKSIKVIKLPRSGGVVSRDAAYMRQVRARALKGYFYGDRIEQAGTRVPQLTPSLIQVATKDLQVFRCTSMSLSASLLPVAAAQTTDKVQLVQVEDWGESMVHTVLAVCHPSAVSAWQQSGRPADLVESGVAGWVAVERIKDDMVHFLGPAAGALPSNILLMGDITWME